MKTYCYFPLIAMMLTLNATPALGARPWWEDGQSYTPPPSSSSPPSSNRTDEGWPPFSSPFPYTSPSTPSTPSMPSHRPPHSSRSPAPWWEGGSSSSPSPSWPGAFPEGAIPFARDQALWRGPNGEMWGMFMFGGSPQVMERWMDRMEYWGDRMENWADRWQSHGSW